MAVQAKDLWQMFMETGVPEYYMLYTKAMRMEGVHVPDDTSFGPSGHGLQ
jgi:hypothetical protein